MEVWNRHLLFAQIAEQKLKRRHLYPLGITLLAVPHSRARRAASDPRLSEPAAPAAKQFPTFKQFVDRKSEERRGHFKQTKKAKQASCEATINVALMEYEGDILKPVRGSSLPLKVEVSSNYNDLKDAAIKKRIVPLMLKGVMYWHIRMQGLPGKSLDQTRILY